MARFEESPGLFGCGVGTSTVASIQCWVCNEPYNSDWNEVDDVDGEDGAVLNTDFAGLDVCECCFEKIERAVLNRMDDILPWYTRILEARKKRLAADRGRLAAARAAQPESEE